MIRRDGLVEIARLLLLGVTTLVAEFLIIPRSYGAVSDLSVHWNFNLATMALCAPQLIVMFLLVAACGPYRNRMWFGVYFVFVVLVLTVVFELSEVWFSKDWYGV